MHSKRHDITFWWFWSASPPIPLFGIPPYQCDLLRREMRGARQNLPAYGVQAGAERAGASMADLRTLL
jgi:tRNA G10  N-methylase Trm11